MYEKLLVTFTFQKHRNALWEKSSETFFKRLKNDHQQTGYSVF